VEVHHGIGADNHVVSYLYFSEYLGSRGDINPVPDGGHSPLLAPARDTDHDPCGNIAAFADGSFGVHHDFSSMPYIKPRTDPRLYRNLNPGDQGHEPVKDSSKNHEDLP